MSKEKPPIKAGDVYPAHVLRDEYGFNAKNRPYFKVEPEEVPESLRHLIPLVEKWAIPCDVTRGDFFEHEGEEQVAKFFHDVTPFIDEVSDWVDGQGDDTREWSDAAVHFMYFIKSYGDAYQPTPEEIEAREKRFAKIRAENDERKAKEVAVIAFKEQNYEQVVRLLLSYEESLSKTLKAKLQFSQKKIADRND